MIIIFGKLDNVRYKTRIHVGTTSIHLKFRSSDHSAKGRTTVFNNFGTSLTSYIIFLNTIYCKHNISVRSADLLYKLE